MQSVVCLYQTAHARLNFCSFHCLSVISVLCHCLQWEPDRLALSVVPFSRSPSFILSFFLPPTPNRTKAGRVSHTPTISTPTLCADSQSVLSTLHWTTTLAHISKQINGGACTIHHCMHETKNIKCYTQTICTKSLINPSYCWGIII